MRFSSVAALALASSLVSAAPTKRQSTNLDPAILQFALTLEHLENAFYKKVLSRWSVDDFVNAGFTADYYNQLKYVVHDEEGHVVYLQAGLRAAGLDPVKPCTYAFPDLDVKGFVATTAVVEGLGVSAYLGAAASITSKDYLTAAGSILVVEALHQAVNRGANGQVASANVFGTPLGPNAVFSIASGFITSCPDSNFKLPFTAYPNKLTLVGGLPTAQDATITVKASMPVNGEYCATFVSGLSILPVDVESATSDGIVIKVPTGAEGQSYVFITKDNSGNLTDDNIIAGPAIIEVTPSSPTFDLNII